MAAVLSNHVQIMYKPNNLWKWNDQMIELHEPV